jgi:hypothetical protein
VEDHSDWNIVIRRLIDEANRTLSNNRHGCAIVSINLVVTAGGRPLLWVVPPGKRVEPSKSAVKNIADLLEGLTAE